MKQPIDGKATRRGQQVASHLQKPSLCFLDAFHARKSGQISWDEYLRYVLVHLKGIKHKEDDVVGIYYTLRKTDPFGYGIFCWSQDLEQKITDIEPFEAVFQAYRTGSVEETRKRLPALDEKHIKHVRGSLALLALQERQAQMLEMCLNQEGGFPYEAYFVDEADSMEESQDPETFRVLERSDLREYYPRLPPGPGRDDDPAATFDRGGKLPVDW